METEIEFTELCDRILQAALADCDRESVPFVRSVIVRTTVDVLAATFGADHRAKVEIERIVRGCWNCCNPDTPPNRLLFLDTKDAFKVHREKSERPVACDNEPSLTRAVGMPPRGLGKDYHVIPFSQVASLLAPSVRARIDPSAPANLRGDAHGSHFCPLCRTRVITCPAGHAVGTRRASEDIGHARPEPPEFNCV